MERTVMQKMQDDTLAIMEANGQRSTPWGEPTADCAQQSRIAIAPQPLASLPHREKGLGCLWSPLFIRRLLGGRARAQ